MGSFKFKEFYSKLSPGKKITLWVSLFVILFSIVRVAIWQTKGGVPGPRGYLKRLASDSPEVKKFAIYEVGRRGLQTAVIPLIKIVREDPDPEVKRAAAASLWKIDKNQLIALLDEKQKDVKYTVMDTLIKFGRENVSYLLERFSEEDNETKMKILFYVDYTKDTGYRDKILEIAENAKEDTQIRITALQIVAKYEMDEQTESRLRNLYYNDPEDRIKGIAYKLINRASEN